ncbi:MAG TPA: hypothetical protein DIU28_09565 [Anabaena sp. UBA12330]|nr:hypothetical protein [Anabaena sp. UBA12330]
MNNKLLPITNYQLPITNYQLPITNYQLPITYYQLPITKALIPTVENPAVPHSTELYYMGQFLRLFSDKF